MGWSQEFKSGIKAEERSEICRRKAGDLDILVDCEVN
jgi:hypothetical protein